MSNQLVITSGAKVRSLEGVLTGTDGVVSSVPYGGANGVATLDSSGKVPLSQLPASVITYLGTWNAATNTPTLTNGVGDVGDLYICNVAGTVNFGAGPITFAVGDWVIYSGTTWEKSGGASGTVTSVAMTTPTGLTVTGSPITTSGTLAVSLASGYTIPTTSFLAGLVPYTGATQTLDMGAYDVNARGFKVNGTAGNGHVDFKHQSGTPTGSASSTTLFANSDGNMAWLNDHLYITTIVTNSNTADRSYTFPDYSGTVALLSGSQTFSGQKTFSSVIIGDSGVSLKEGVIPSAVGYTGLAGDPDGLLISKKIGTTAYTNLLSFTSATSNTYTFPNASGTIALTSNLSSYVPYTGATGNVNLGTNEITASNLIAETSFSAKHLTSGIPYRNGYTTFSAGADSFNFAQAISAGNLKSVIFDLSNLVNNTSYTYGLPAASGTFALLESTQTFTGSKTFTGAVSFNNSLGNSPIVNRGFAFVKGNTPSATSGVWSQIYSASGNNNIVIADNSNTSTLQFQASSSYTYTFPTSSGTLALTSSLSSYVPYSGATANVDLGINNLKAGSLFAEGVTGSSGGLLLKQGTGSVASLGYTSLSASGNTFYIYSIASTGTDKIAAFNLSSLTSSTTRTYTLPDASGTLALTSDLTSYVTLATTQTISGQKTFSGGILVDSGSIALKNNINVSLAGYTGLGVSTSGTTDGFRLYFGSGYNSGFNFTNTATNTYTFPNASGTIALTSNIPTVSGTTNYISKFTGTSTLGNSLIYDNGTNVGIGTSSPAQKLSVNGNIRIDGSGLTEFIINNGTNEWEMYMPSGSNDLRFYRGTDKMTLTSGGNVGIGTTNPNTKLNVIGAIQTDNNGLNNLLFNSAGTNYGTIQNDAADKWSLGTTTTAGTLGTPILTWTKDGKVGINNSSPTGALDVANRGITKGSLPAGTILQVVNFQLNSGFSTTSNSDQDTGLNASITPTSSSSKILIIISANLRATAGSGNCYVYGKVWRGAVTTGTPFYDGYAMVGNYNSTDFRSIGNITLLDSPATTSSVTYRFSINASLAGTAVALNSTTNPSTITLMEIAQ